jgi:hypothetical protein
MFRQNRAPGSGLELTCWEVWIRVRTDLLRSVDPTVMLRQYISSRCNVYNKAFVDINKKLKSRYEKERKLYFLCWISIWCRYITDFNLNPHYFKDKIKLTPSGWKEPLLYPFPCTALWGERGEKGAFSAALKICLIKTWFTLTLSSKAHWKRRFYLNPWNKQKFAEIFKKKIF